MRKLSYSESTPRVGAVSSSPTTRRETFVSDPLLGRGAFRSDLRLFDGEPNGRDGWRLEAIAGRVAPRDVTGNALGMEITCVTIDSANPAAIASFWNDALAWGGVATSDDDNAAICGPQSDGWYLEFVQVPEVKATKNRVHLGCSAGSLDALEHEITRLCQLGATLAWEEEFSPEIRAAYRNVVLRDPEGNEFCLSAGAIPGA